LGLLDIDTDELTEPVSTPISSETQGHWCVEHHEELSVWRCLCGRSDPILVPATHRGRVRLPNDLIKACEVCRHQLDAAGTGKSALFKAWLERNRSLISPDSCLEYPEDAGWLYSENDQRTTRTERAAYEMFYKVNLKPDDFVCSVCSNNNCINPHHLRVRSAPRLKVTSKVETAIVKLKIQGFSASATKTVLQEKLGTNLCLSTIYKIRGEKKLLSVTTG
jgi:hypothetical protein